MANQTQAVRYVGPHSGVVVDRSGGELAEVKRGDSLVVPAELAERLLAQPSNWQPPAEDDAAKPGKKG